MFNAQFATWDVLKNVLTFYLQLGTVVVIFPKDVKVVIDETPGLLLYTMRENEIRR